MRAVIVTMVKGEEARTDSAPISELRRVKEHALAEAERLRNAKKTFHIYVASDQDPNDLYLEVFNDGTLKAVPV